MQHQPREPRSLADRLRLESDRIASLILYSDMPWIDIQIQIGQMREIVEDQQPERLPLFDQIYESRFRRLWEQWREGS